MREKRDGQEGQLSRTAQALVTLKMEQRGAGALQEMQEKHPGNTPPIMLEDAPASKSLGYLQECP